jgi:hypothetical protein
MHTLNLIAVLYTDPLISGYFIAEKHFSGISFSFPLNFSNLSLLLKSGLFRAIGHKLR